MKRAAIIGIVVVAALAAGGCGSSSGTASSDSAPPTTHANSTVCTAVDDVKSQATKLQGLTNGSLSPTAALTAVQALENDLSTLKTQASTLSGSVRQNLDHANAAFSSQVQAIAQSVTGSSSQSLAAAAGKLATAAQQLAQSYRQAFSGLSC
jgi:hypothetical protein